MSTAKVNTSAPVGHTQTNMVKLGNMGASPASASVVGVVDSANVGTSTDQYLPNDDYGSVPVGETVVEEAPILSFGMTFEASAVMETQLKYDNFADSYLSIREKEQQIEKYEKTIEEIETPLRKKTQGFG